MTDRRRSSSTYMQAGSPAYQEIKKTIADVADRTEAVFDRLEKRLDRMDKDVQRTEIGHGRLATELGEIRRDVGELRDATHLAAKKAADAVVVAAPTAAAAASGMTVAALPKTWWGKGLIAATGFTTIMIALGNIPDAARGFDRFWAWVKNEPPAVIRPHAEPVLQGKQDTTSSK